MTPEEKAEEICNKFHKYTMNFDTAKILTMIAINEIIASNPTDFYYTDSMYIPKPCYESKKPYWEQVKYELIKLKP